MRARAGIVFLIYLLVAVSCRDSADSRQDPEPPGASPKGGAALSPPIDLAAVIRQVHFAFRPDEQGFSGGHDSYAIQASDTEITVTPRAPEPSVGAHGLTLKTRGVERGGVSSASGRPRAAVDKDGSLSVERGSVVERLANGEEGVEQSFHFDARPDGQGELRVHIGVSGMPYTARTEHGLHFADPVSGAGVRYGRATWVDASARRSDLETTYEEGEIVLHVPEALVEGSTYPAVLDPVIGPEIGTDNPIYHEGAFSQAAPSVASNGSDYLVVWSDSRVSASNADIYGARVTSTGVLIDPGGLAISTSPLAQVAPSVAFDGVNYLVVWQDKRNNAITKEDIYGARVAPTGVVLDLTGFPISTVALSQLKPSVAFNGTTFLVVWEDGRAAGPADIYGSRVTTGGTVLDAAGIALSVAQSDQLRPRLASDGSSFLVVWTDKRAGVNGVYGTRVGSDGTVVDPNGLAIAPSVNNVTHAEPAIAFSGSNYLVAWTESCRVRGQRFDPVTAQPIDAAPLNITSCGFEHAGTTVAYGNGYYFVATEQDPLNTSAITGNWVNAVTAAVTPAGSSTTVSDAAADYAVPAVASNGSSFLVAWHRASGSGAIRARQVTIPNAPSTPIIKVGVVTIDQTLPAVDFNGAHWLVAWIDAGVRAVRLDAQGTVLDPAGITVNPPTFGQGSLAISHDPTHFFVVWSDARGGTPDIYGARVDGANGTVLDPNGLSISTASASQTSPKVAFDGTNYLVVWNDNRLSNNVDIFGARVSAATGATLEIAGFPISTLAGTEGTPSVASNGSQFLVVWADGGAARGTRVTPGGGVVDPGGFPISATPVAHFGASVAFGQSDYFVTWTDKRTGTFNIYGARVDPAISVLDPNGIAISTGAHVFGSSSVSFDGFNFVTTFTDTTDGFAYASWIRQDGVVLGPAGFAVSTAKVQGPPALTSNGLGDTLFAYSRDTPEPPFGSNRVWARLAQFGSPLGAVCSGAADCVSGWCVDGVCCNTLCGNGALNDCQACSVAAGASVDGTCSPLPQGLLCRPSGGICDVAEVCDGVALTCPTNVFVSAATVCGPSTGPCDPAETCTGQFPLCPANVVLPNDTACNDGDACTSADHCAAGVCVGAPVLCANTNQCTPSGACDPQTGQCVYTVLPDATPCDDGDACTQVAACQNGMCAGSAPLICPPPDQCHFGGACNAQTGVCSNPVMPDMSPCDDGDACTQSDVCINGACTAGAPVVCPKPDQCHVGGTCDPETGVCSAPAKKADGTGCSDANACTQMDVCQNGVCSGLDPIVCPEPDACHNPGKCSPGTGKCSTPSKANGAPCPGGSCHAGKCVMDGAGGGGNENTGGGSTVASGTGGAGGAGSTGAEASSTGTGGSSEPGGGCSCGVAGSSGGGAPWAVLVALFAMLRGERRRARSRSFEDEKIHRGQQDDDRGCAESREP